MASITANSLWRLSRRPNITNKKVVAAIKPMPQICTRANSTHCPATDNLVPMSITISPVTQADVAAVNSASEKDNGFAPLATENGIRNKPVPLNTTHG